MNGIWKPVDLILPETLSPRQVLDQIHAQIRINATESGDFVHQIQVGVGQAHSHGWTRWCASYLAGPPAPFPVDSNSC
ncbi:hypothetical protein GGC64_005821 [Mycobacterium sp. OAS707]|nr:hypothetical protein [Mycobacterium sp. OAS707]